MNEWIGDIISLFLNINSDTKIGKRHRNLRSAVKILETISDTMHSKIVKFLTDEKITVSIILYGSTNTTPEHYIVVLFQTNLYNKHSVVLFSKLIPIGLDRMKQLLEFGMTTLLLL